MPRRRIFVSHSNNDPTAAAYLEVIDAQLKAAGYDVLIDRTRLEPGMKWRDEIYTWMGLCHGAVVLVSDAAIRPESIWVPRETSILLWRRTLDPKFVVVPVCLGNVTIADLNRGVLADTQLNELTTASGDSPLGVADSLLERFQPLAVQKTPLEKLANRLEELLQSASTGAIEEAADQLAVDLGAWSPQNDIRHTLALSLLQVPLRKAADAFLVLAEYLESSKADQILDIIRPSWVDLCAARWLADCATRVEPKPAVVLNAVNPVAARMYVYRAGGQPPKTRWPIVIATGVFGEYGAAEIAAEIEQSLIHEFRLADDPWAPDARTRLVNLLRERQADSRPVFVSIKYSPAIAGVLAELQRLLPSLTFVLLSGDEFPPSAALESAHIRLVEPRLEPGAEARAQIDYDFVSNIVKHV